MSREENLIKKSALHFKKIGEDDVTNLVTDGEHMAINLYDKGEKNADKNNKIARA